MSNTGATDTQRVGDLAGQTVVVIGGSSGMGLETARQAKDAGASVIITGRNRARLEEAGKEINALSTSELDLDDPDQLDGFFAGLPATIDHVFVTGSGPPYGPITELDFEQVRSALEEHLVGALRITKACAGRVRPGGSLTLITGTYARRPGIGLSVAAIEATAVPAIVANIAVELAPMRANAIAAGFVDTPLSGRLLGDDIEHRREELRSTLPIRRVVGPADVAALVIHLMTNTAVTGATYDIDGGQHLLP